MPPNVQPSGPAPYSAVLAWVAHHAGCRRVERAEPAGGRVLAEAVVAPHAIPPRAEAALDGVALCAAQTHGAGEYAPAVVAGRPVQAGDALIAPEDAVVPGGAVDWVGAQGAVPTVAVVTPVAGGAGIRAAGSVIAAGTVALAAGTVLGPAALGLLAAMGVTRTALVALPRVAVLAGPSLVPMLTAAIKADGGVAEALPGVDAYGTEWARAGRFDLIVVSGPAPFAALHAAATGPGGSFGTLDEVPIVSVPLDAEGALAATLLIARPLIRARAGLPLHPTQLRLTHPIASGLGWTELVWLRPDGTPAGPGLHAATAGMYTIIDAGSEGAPAGAMVDAWT